MKYRYTNDLDKLNAITESLIELYCTLNNGMEDKKLSGIKKYFEKKDCDESIRLWVEHMRFVVSDALKIIIDRDTNLMIGTVPIVLTPDFIKNILKIQKS